MGYQIKFTDPDGSTHIHKRVYKTKAGAEKKAKWWKEVLKPTVRVVKSRD